MTVELKKNSLRIRLVDPKYCKSFRTVKLGEKVNLIRCMKNKVFVSQSLILKLNKFKDYREAIIKLKDLNSSFMLYESTYNKAYRLILKYFKVEKYG